LFADGKTSSFKPTNFTLCDDGDDAIVNIVGGDGGEFGIRVYKSWAGFYQRHPSFPMKPGTKPSPPPSDNGTFMLMVEFGNLDNHPEMRPMFAKDEALRRRLKAPLAKNSCPMLIGFSEHGQPLTRGDLLLTEAALFSAVRFVRLLRQRPYPPPPYFCPTSFEPRKEQMSYEVNVVQQNAHRPKAHELRIVQARCTFPSGNIPTPFYKWGCYPELVQLYAPRPRQVCGRYAKGVVTIQEAINHHRDKVEGPWAFTLEEMCERGDLHLYAELYGLAIALWEGERPEEVQEAVAIGERLLEILPKDPHDIKKDVLQWMLEAGAWDSALKLLGSYPDHMNNEFLWSTVLVTQKVRGRSSKMAKGALLRAIRLNPEVLPLLLGESPTVEGELESARLFCRNCPTYVERENGWEAVEPRLSAVVYCFNQSKFWHADTSTMEWLRSCERSARKKTADGVRGVQREEQKAGAQKMVAQALCAMCKTCKPTGRNKLLACSRCKQVYYCSQQCQKEHWKVHKQVCGKTNATKAKPEQKTGLYDPTWEKLTPIQRENLRKYHEECGCLVPWPVSVETPAMLNPGMCSFLCSHPAMQWQAELMPLAGGFRMAYNGQVGAFSISICACFLNFAHNKPCSFRSTNVSIHTGWNKPW
jgi:hypothetical protein